jgi:NAD(P)-dependent dehydrogenase (short-subunit alcohol dehydrogenase family)
VNRVLNKIIIVSGGGSGIGKAASMLLASEGAKVALVDIDGVSGQATTEAILALGHVADFWHMDASNETSVQQTVDEIARKYGRIDVLVNNVGVIGDNKPTHELTEREWDHVMNVNVKSVFFCTKYAIPHFQKAGGGSIVNISSVHGLIGTPDFPGNHASKGAVRLMSKTDAMLYAKDQIRVNSIHPGYIRTPLLEKVDLPSMPVGEPMDVAFGILYLASDESKFITASELVIDGGMSGGRLA